LYRNQFVAVIIPVLNEEESIGKVIAEIPDFVDRIVVCDNGSIDNTPNQIKQSKAELVFENERGYGAACLKALLILDERTDIIVFIDGDYSDYPEEMNLLLDPIIDDNYEVVIGSRMIKPEAKKILTPVARFGNWLSTFLIKIFWGYRFTDLGPFRAIKYDSFKKLKMVDRNFGWTVELQIKAAKMKMNAIEVPVSYRARLGKSKISGTLVGSCKAGSKILYLIFRELF
jgi:glycosyltransferase involved in cell wall biosynthesis